MLKIRISQALREVGQLTLVYKIIFLGIVLSIGTALFVHIQQVPNNRYVAGFITLTILYIHLNRRDKQFLSIAFTYPGVVCMLEYLIFGLPLWILFLISDQWFIGLIPVVATIFISGIHYTTGKGVVATNLLAFIPSQCFEWISGFRRFHIYLILTYLLCLGLSPFKYVSLFILWILLAFISSFYDECEPVNMLVIKEIDAVRFLHWKIVFHLKLFLVFSLPLVICYSIFNFDTLWIMLLIYAVSVINLVLFIVIKYAYYEPMAKLTAATGIIKGIALFGVIIPFLIPIPLLMCFTYYQKAVKNLNRYLYVYH